MLRCGFCKASLSKGRFCNQSCAAKHNNPKRARPRLCAVCGKPTRQKYKFCDAPSCAAHRLRRRTTLDACLKDSTRRRYLVRVRGHRCEVCRRTRWGNQAIPLELDHIDGDYTNNTEQNLRLVCPNCHAQTPTYKNRNRGKGRTCRRSSLGRAPHL